MQRTDWYLHNGDSFGELSASYASHDNRYGKLSQLSDGSNELMMENGVAIKDAAGVQVESDHDKQQLMQRLTAAGITEVNTIPLDKFIVVYNTSSGKSRSALAKLVYGLKPGVLP